ncbi:competence type IV pilus minor pilin ComGD [Enterococcus ureasiticus]|uniref:Prepilin-type N-terminal cleavage/methylation domain-containing protein n=1 Tax=Enterococcus ureasiticus TaxID=903984 RepID=A0A1E5GF82_9ENTE|nr:competence type IV pilus minor pilin ComGD [Enterococcus ureasiticus]OEG11311.1 prepilin-type N-terminal cleavage/methylation domain-containing protein [Enterococcus ureasiticus]
MKGFTLIESLVVLFICTIFMLLPTLTINKWKQVLEVDQFLSSFEKKLLFTQQMAVVNTVDTQVIFFEQSQQINFKNGQVVEEILEIPVSLQIAGPEKIIFKKGSGNIGKLSKFSFSWIEKNQLIEFQFQLGSGRYVKKIKQL